MVNVARGLINFVKRVDNLDVDKLKTVSVDLKKSDVMNKEVVKDTKLKKLNTKVNNLEKKIADGSILIQTNECNIEKKLGQKMEDVDRKYLTLVV